MTVDMKLGDSPLILSACMQHGLLRNQAAYLLATAFWETAHTMKPVEEAFWLSEDWRRRNLRYYPWHGRGFVQLTWERNYHKASAELGIDLTTDPTKAMQPDIAAQVLVVGCKEGWFTGKKLDDFLTVKASDYRGARRVVNGTDKASAIAEIARDYEAALLAHGYGVERPAPVVNERRDGTAPRSNPLQSTTNIAAFVAALGTLGTLSTQLKGVVAQVTDDFGVTPDTALVTVALAGIGWVFRERLKKWADGDR